MSLRVFVETSALVAIALQETGWEALVERIEDAEATTTAIALFEASLALTRVHAMPPKAAHAVMQSLADRLDVKVTPFLPEMGALAAEARERFGTGRRKLNLGDCLSYAAARHAGAELVYVGDDFAQTDVNATDPRP